jgi:hypothetical protein
MSTHEEAIAQVRSHIQQGCDSECSYCAEYRYVADMADYALRLEEALREILGQFDQAHTALDVAYSPSAQEAIEQASKALASKPEVK